MSDIISINDFRPTKQDTVLLDTNILINLFYPTNFESSTTDSIDSLYVKLRHAKSNLILSSIQLSELINRCIRIQFNLYKQLTAKPELNFKKDYRCTEDYTEKMNAILDIIRSDIIPSFKFIDDGFSTISPDKIFLSGCSYDFNDALIVEIARQHKAFLITNDGDFYTYGEGLKIVTSNNFLLKFR